MKSVRSQARITLGMSLLVGLAVLIMSRPHAPLQPVSSGRMSQVETSRSAQVKVSRAELPLSFEPNLGQSEPQVKFLSRVSGYKLFLTADEAVLLLKNSVPKEHSGATPEKQDGKHAVLAMRLVGANRAAAVTGLAEFPGTSNYFIGNDPTKWHMNVPNYGKVQYENIYPGVDLVYYGNQTHLEYDFVIAPGVDPRQINLAFEGQPNLQRPRLDANGELVLNVDGREVRFHKPFVHQPASKPGVQTSIEGRYVLRADNQVGFEVGQYDRSKTLVIDPVLVYSSYLGGNDYDQGYGIAVDSSGNILLAGTTASTNFPTANAVQSQYNGNEDLFVTKFNPSGTSLIYSTYFGGSSYDQCEALVVDSSGDVYVTGYTTSKNFPILNAIQQNLAGTQNIFVSEFSPTGSLVSSTYYGGSANDEAFGIALDSSGVYVVGSTTSTNYPTVNPFQAKRAAGQDAFLTKFNTAVSSVIYSTYLGGVGGGSTAYSVAVDSSESPYLAGQTRSPSFPMVNAFQNQNKAGAGTIFITKFNPAGNTLAYSTYLGGTSEESAGSIAVDASGNAYVSGGSMSANFPTTPNAFQTKNAGGWDVIVAKLNSSGNALIYSTYIGGKYNDFGDAMAVDSLGNAHVGGYAFSNNFPVTANAFQSQNGGTWNGIVLELNSAGSALIYSSYLGGNQVDGIDALGLDSFGDTFVTGFASSTNFPIAGSAFQSTYGGGSDDAYLSEVSAVTTYPLTVSLAGTGTGTVTSSPAGINCGTVCSTTFISGTVTLTATGGTGSIFEGWSGACSGQSTCTVNLTSSESVTATFITPTFSVLTNFGSTGGSGQPTNPTYPGIIAQGTDGNLYSTTPEALGGIDGAVFNVTPSGTLSMLSTFGAGGAPQSGLTLGTDGNFYGTTFGCSVGGDGTIFQFVPTTDAVNTLYSFTGGTDGKCPTAPPIQGIDGNFYGTTTTSNTSGVYGSVYKFTLPNTFKALVDLNNTDGASPAAPLMQTNGGSFYGTTQAGGSTGVNDGEVYMVAVTGAFSAPLTFNGTNGQDSVAPVIQGTDGNFYGTTVKGGTSALGVVFKMTTAGAITVLHNFAGNGDGAYPYGGLVQASDGNYYGTTSQATASTGCGTIYRISNGVFATIFTFPSNGSSGCNPQVTLVQHTNGTIYGDTNTGGSTIGSACTVAGPVGISGCGTFFSLSATLPEFIRLVTTSGNVGSSVVILGQGFSSSSVVEFNGVPATAVTVTGTTSLTATVPAGAGTGFVTVTTGTTTLTSLVPYLVHNAWSSGAPIPVAVAAPATGFVGANSLYVVGGYETSGGGPVNNNQFYNTTSNSWTTAAPIPTPVFGAASAVINNNLFVIGGYETAGGAPTNLVQVYNVPTNSWSTDAAMTTARGYATAVVNGSTIWVIGGSGSSGPLSTAEVFTPSTNSWAEEPPMLTAKSGLSAGLLPPGAIVAADGSTSSGDTGDNERYNFSTNSWMSLPADPSPRNASCFGGSTLLYAAGGLNNSSPQAVTSVNESFNAASNKWTTLTPMPTATFWPGSAVGNGLLYCIGGQTSTSGAAVNNVQIYQP